MKYAFTATPSVFDLDFDGYADAVFAADLGGNVWKWLIHDAVLDPINGDGRPPAQLDQRLLAVLQDLHGRELRDGARAARCRTTAASSTRRRAPWWTARSGSLWAAASATTCRTSGRRLAEKNRYYVFQDKDPFERERAAVTTGSRFTDVSPSTDFVNVTSLSGACNPPPSPAVGFYLEGRPGREVRHRLHDLLRGGADQLLQADDVLGSV